MPPAARRGFRHLTKRREKKRRLIWPSCPEALAVHREVGNRHALAQALGNLVALYRESGRPEAAEESGEQALAIVRAFGERANEGVALGQMAGLYHETGRHERAEAAFEQAVAIHRSVRNARWEGIHLCDWSLLRLSQGRHPEAGGLFREGIAILARIGDTVALESRRKEMQAACRAAGVSPFDSLRTP
ncbi:MAG: TPR repeat-containing [Planctomycetota bacterium]|nr:MAG: TPR repeat-containing [Planctomycetota bacterium]